MKYKGLNLSDEFLIFFSFRLDLSIDAKMSKGAAQIFSFIGSLIALGINIIIFLYPKWKTESAGIRLEKIQDCF